MPLITSSSYFVSPILRNARGVAVDGFSHDAYVNTQDWTTGVDNKLITVSVWLKYDFPSENGFFIEGQTSSDFFIRGIRTSGKMRYAIHGPGGLVLYFDSGITVAGTDLHHTLFTADLSDSGKRKVWIDGVVDTGVTWHTYTNSNIDWVSTKNQQIWEEWIADRNRFRGSIAEFWFTNEYLGIDDSNVNKFYSGGQPMDLGSDGSIPTGNQPIAYYSVRSGDTAADFGVNRGSGPNFTTIGTPTVVSLW